MFRLILLVFILAWFSVNLLGQPDSTLRTKETDSVIIRFNGQQLERMHTHAGKLFIGEEIHASKPEDLGDLTRTIPGVFIRSYGGAGGLKTINARGLGSQHFLLVSNAQAHTLAQAGSANLGEVQVDGLQQISYSIGGSDSWSLPAVAYAYSGVLALEFADFNFNRSKDFTNFGFSLGSFGRTKVNAAFHQNSGKSAIFGHAYWYGLHGAYPFAYNNGFTEFRETRLHNKTREGLLRLGYQRYLNEKNTIQISGIYQIAHRELPGALVFYQPDSYQLLDNKNLDLNVVHQFKRRRIQGMNFINGSHHITQYVDSFFVAGVQNDQYLEQNLDVGHNGTLKFSKSMLNWALQYLHTRMDASVYENQPSRNRWATNIGYQIWRENWKMRINLPAQLVVDERLGHQNADFIFSPSIGGKKTFNSTKALGGISFSAGQFARVATFSELYFNPLQTSDLKPEISRSLNLGYYVVKAFKKLEFSLDLDAFYGFIQDKIIAIPTQNLFVWSFRNLQEVRSYGFDAQLGLDFSRHGNKDFLSMLFKSSLNVSQDVSDQESSTYLGQIPYTPFWSHGADLSYRLRQWTFSSMFMFHDFRFVLGENIAANVLPAYHILDFRINYEFKNKESKRISFRTHFKANNILNHQYQVIRGFPMPGRNFEIGVQIGFE